MIRRVFQTIGIVIVLAPSGTQGANVAYSYDSLNRLTSAAYNQGQQVVFYTYDAAGNMLSRIVRIDTDLDGYFDDEDAFPNDPTEWLDTDGDGVGDNGDAFPNDPSETTDTDGDGIGNNADPDDDNDGVPDESDAFPLDPNEAYDTDSDGVGDNGDNCPSTSNNDQIDDDNDDLGNVCDNCRFVANASQLDYENDGIGNRCEVWLNDLMLSGGSSLAGDQVTVFKWVSQVSNFEGAVKDPLTALAGSPIEYLTSGRQPVDTGIADISGSSALAVLGVDGNGRAWVEVKDATSGNLIQDVWYPPGYTPVSLAIVPDLNNNGASELAVLLTRDSDGRGWVHIKDAATGDLIRYIWLRTGYTPVDLEILPDLDGNSGDEVAVLMTRDSDGRAWVEVKDAKTGNLVKYVWFRKDHTPLDLEIVPDQDGNPGAELAVLMSRDSDSRTWVEVKDTLTNALVRYVWFKKDHTPVDLEIVPNFNGNPGSELAVLMTRDSDNRTWVQTKDSANGDVVSYIWFQPDFSPRDLEVMDNLDGNPANDLAVLGEKGDGRVQVEFKDPQTGAFINRLGFN